MGTESGVLSSNASPKGKGSNIHDDFHVIETNREL
jgi:hypothetical protein